MSAFRAIRLHKENRVGHIWLNRPHVLNAYNLDMRDELHQVLAALKDDDEVVVVVLRGAGTAFCVGADLTEFGTAPSQAIARRVRRDRDVWGSFLGLGKPMVCGIQGYCMGSGLEMALLCDLRIASDDAVFCMPEVGLGMVPAAGGTQTLPRVLGIGPALELLLTQRRVEAVEALEMGLVTRMVTLKDLDSAVQSLTRCLLGLSRQAVAAARRAVWDGMELPLASGLELELRLASEIAP